MSRRLDRPIKLKVCQRGCGRTVKANDRFCSAACKRADYNERKRDERAAYKARVDAAVQEILRRDYYCPSCEPEKGSK